MGALFQGAARTFTIPAPEDHPILLGLGGNSESRVSGDIFPLPAKPPVPLLTPAILPGYVGPVPDTPEIRRDAEEGLMGHREKPLRTFVYRVLTVRLFLASLVIAADTTGGD
jgi:hypothetical protein